MRKISSKHILQIVLKQLSDLPSYKLTHSPGILKHLQITFIPTHKSADLQFLGSYW